MEAMILAAGEGRRLRPLTESLPKALVEVGGRPLLERVAGRLIEAGAHRLIINAHYRADQIESFVGDREGFGVSFVISREDGTSPVPLDTGGALVFAADAFERREPFFLHNSDVITDADLTAAYRAHVEGERVDGRLATLIVARRHSSRPLLIDGHGIFGRANREEGWQVIARHAAPDGPSHEVGFTGIHVISPRIFDHFVERGAFSLIDTYIRLVGEGHVIGAHDATGAMWHDIGTSERLEAARRALAGKVRAP